MANFSAKNRQHDNCKFHFLSSFVNLRKIVQVVLPSIVPILIRVLPNNSSNHIDQLLRINLIDDQIFDIFKITNSPQRYENRYRPTFERNSSENLVSRRFLGRGFSAGEEMESKERKGKDRSDGYRWQIRFVLFRRSYPYLLNLRAVFMHGNDTFTGQLVTRFPGPSIDSISRPIFRIRDPRAKGHRRSV